MGRAGSGSGPAGGIRVHQIGDGFSQGGLVAPEHLPLVLAQGREAGPEDVTQADKAFTGKAMAS